MFKVQTTQINPRTGKVTHYTLQGGFETREYAERSAERINRDFSQDGVTAKAVEVKARVNNLDAYYEDQRRVNALIGTTDAPVPATPENISHNRLLRAQAGLRHLLLEVIPQITDEQQRREVHLWVDGIYGITCVEEVDTGGSDEAGA